MKNQSDGGVDYSKLDPTKRLGLELARKTLKGPAWLGITIDMKSLGESAPIIQIPLPGYVTQVLEGLGTKGWMAEMLYRLTGDLSGFRATSQCTISMIVNDLITSGILPIGLQMYFAAGTSAWFSDQERVSAIMHGWQDASIESGVAWLGGETPSLKRIILPEAADFAGSAIGYLPQPMEPFRDTVAPGDIIIGFGSSGVHANGMTLIQDLAEAKLGIGKNMADLYRQCLVPTRLYVNLVKEMQIQGLRPSRLENMTGHGARKLMRSKTPGLNYRINKLLPAQDVFGEIQKLGSISTEDMYSSYNMGTGFVAMCRPDDTATLLKIAEDTGYPAEVMGVVQKSHDGWKRVTLEPVGVTFEEESMNIG